MGSRGIDVPLSARRSAERAVQRLRQAEVVEWYRGLRKAIADAERAWRRSYRPAMATADPRHYPSARIAALAVLAGEPGQLATSAGATSSLPTTR